MRVNFEIGVSNDSEDIFIGEVHCDEGYSKSLIHDKEFGLMFVWGKGYGQPLNGEEEAEILSQVGWIIDSELNFLELYGLEFSFHQCSEGSHFGHFDGICMPEGFYFSLPTNLNPQIDHGKMGRIHFHGPYSSPFLAIAKARNLARKMLDSKWI